MRFFASDGSGLDPDSTRVAVIGAGAAGLTTTAACAVLGTEVVLLEKTSMVLPIQSGGTQRYLHPHIYDWPENGCLQSDAGLPILNWQAGPANDVLTKIENEWKQVLATYPEMITTRFQTEVRSIQVSTTDDRRHVLTWEDRVVAGSAAFDVLILAVGFGQERRDIDTSFPYWQNENWDNHLAQQN